MSIKKVSVRDGVQALDKFRQALQLLRDEDPTEVQVSVDDQIVLNPVVDPDTEVETEPLFNCGLADGRVVNVRVSAFCVGKHAEVEDGVFTVQDEDGITHKFRFYLLTQLWFR